MRIVDEGVGEADGEGVGDMETAGVAEGVGDMETDGFAVAEGPINRSGRLNINPIGMNCRLRTGHCYIIRANTAR